MNKDIIAKSVEAVKKHKVAIGIVNNVAIKLELWYSPVRGWQLFVFANNNTLPFSQSYGESYEQAYSEFRHLIDKYDLEVKNE